MGRHLRRASTETPRFKHRSLPAHKYAGRLRAGGSPLPAYYGLENGQTSSIHVGNVSRTTASNSAAAYVKQANTTGYPPEIAASTIGNRYGNGVPSMVGVRDRDHRESSDAGEVAGVASVEW